MGYSYADGCHYALCKWVAKARGTCAAAQSTAIRLKMRLESFVRDGQHDLDEAQLAVLQGIFDRPEDTTWEELGITNVGGSFVSGVSTYYKTSECSQKQG